MLLKNGFVYTDNDFVKADLLIKDGRIIDILKSTEDAPRCFGICYCIVKAVVQRILYSLESS